jgi:SMI1 / KNR4 family (SUKH-1)
MTRSDWADIRERLAPLAGLARLAAESNEAADPTIVWVSSSHGWQLEPPLRTAELAAVESQVRVELPGEYRSFLLQVGRGGAGPGYGLFPLRCVDGRWRWEGDGADLTDLDALAQPFPHVEAFNLADGLPDPPDEDDYDSEEALNAAEHAYWERYEEATGRPEQWVGLLYLCHFGCALREGLVVSGPARGQMWADDSADGAGFRPLVDDDGSPLGFARWYRRWLGDAEAQLARGRHA